MAPKRKGGGTKGFLKTAVRAGAEQGDDAAPQEAAPAVPQPDAGDQSGGDAAPVPANGSAEAHAVSQRSAASATTAPVANGAAAAAEAGRPSPAAEPGEGGVEGGGGGDGGDETRGQMLQRHKKVRCVLVLHSSETRRFRCAKKPCSAIPKVNLLCALQEAKALKDTAKKMGKKRKVRDISAARAAS